MFTRVKISRFFTVILKEKIWKGRVQDHQVTTIFASVNISHGFWFFKGTQAWNFFFTFLQKPKPWSQGPVTRNFENRIGFGWDIRLLNISAHAQHAMKLVPSMLSMRWNSFRVCSECDKILKFVPRMLSIDYTVHILTAGWACAEIRSSYARCAMKSVPRMLSMR